MDSIWILEHGLYMDLRAWVLYGELRAWVLYQFYMDLRAQILYGS